MCLQFSCSIGVSVLLQQKIYSLSYLKMLVSLSAALASVLEARIKREVQNSECHIKLKINGSYGSMCIEMHDRYFIEMYSCFL